MSGQTSVQPYRPAPTPSMSDTVNLLTGIKDFQAKQATANAYQQSIDPQTGAFDQGKFNALLAGSPQGAWNIGPAMQQSGQAQQATGQGQTAQINAQFAQQQNLNRYLVPLMQQVQDPTKGPVTGQQVLDAMAQAGPNVSPQLAANIRQQVASIGGPTGDASNIVRGGFFANQATMEQLKTALPPVQPVGLGSTVQPFQPSPLAAGGAGFTGRGVGAATSMTPGDASSIVSVDLGNGQAIQVPKGIAAGILSNNPQLQRLNPGLVPSGGGSGTGGAPVTNQSFGPNQGRYTPPAGSGSGGGGSGSNAPPPPAPSSAPAWLQPPPPLPTGGSAGGVGVSAAPGYVESQKATAAASTTAANALQSQISQSPNIRSLLSDMDTQLRTQGFSSGMGSTVVGSIHQLSQRLGLTPEAPSAGLDTASPQAAQEEFAKNAARLQAAQLGALGNPTDARQELSETTNPGLMLSKYGNQGIIHMLQGNQQAIEAQGDAWARAQQQGWTPDRYNEWLNNNFLATDKVTGGRFDPRAFWIANMPTLAEQQQYIKKVPEAQQAQLFANMQYAKNFGWIGQAKDGRATVPSP
jgi:hypothetical protein